MIFLAHGIGAIADHMKNIQYNIEVLFPDVMVVSSKINEDDTSISIAEMGLNLAKEVEQYIYMNCYKSLERLSFIGHSMGAAGALELAGNLPAFRDKMVHPTINVDELDPQCNVGKLVIGEPVELGRVDAIFNNSFGMLGINSSLVVTRFQN